MSNVFVNQTGFQKKTLTEIKSELEIQFQQIFGNDIDLDPSGTFGQLISIMSKNLADLWDGSEEIYTSRDPLEATFTSLDNIVAENGIQRLAATKTTVLDVMLTGANTTVITAGKRAKNTNQTIEYILDNDVTIDKTVAREGYISVSTVTSGNDYTVTIDSINYTYTALVSDTENDILIAIKALIDAGAWGGIVIVTGNNMKIENTTVFSFDIIGDLLVDGISNPGNFTSDTAGAYTLPANSLTEIVTPVTNWDSVNNPSAGATGRNVETDAELRLRRSTSVINGFATDTAITEALFNNVEGVTSVITISNRSDIVDGEGRDPHSFESVVVGGSDTEIATEIFRVQPAGIQSFGNTSIDITDSQGVIHPINFSRPVDQYIHVRISRSLYSEENYPANGDDLIKSNIVNWSLDTNNINVGKDVIRQRLATPVYGVADTTYPVIPGIEDINIEIAVTATPGGTPAFGISNIVIAAREIAVFAISRITVQAL